MKHPDRPLVLCLSGHDPTGGAGIQADIEAVAAQGAHALSVITAHTVQDTGNVTRVSAVAPILLAAQIAALLDDCAISAIKIGLLGDVAQIEPICAAIVRARVPVVMDPVLRAGGGTPLVSTALGAKMAEALFPLIELITPNVAEARALASQTRNGSRQDWAQELIRAGARNVLITGGDEDGPAVINTWHTADAAPRDYRWPRIEGGFHGAGCTLAAAVAALIARGLSMADALERAQAYTHETLRRAIGIGQGRKIPLRWP